MPPDHIQFVTGRLAEHSLRQVLEPLAREVGFDYTVDVMPITVAALMTPLIPGAGPPPTTMPNLPTFLSVIAMGPPHFKLGVTGRRFCLISALAHASG